jgi:UPF0755 protein
MRKALLAVIIVVVLVAAFFTYKVVSYASDVRGAPNGKPVKVTVTSGASLSGLGPSLQRAGVIGSVTDYKIYLRVTGSSVDLQKGEYNLRTHMAYGDILSALGKGPSVAFERVTIPEGFTVTQTAARVAASTHISAADFLAAATTSTSSPTTPAPQAATLEGYLYPQTYFVDPKETAAGLVHQMISQFDKEASGLSWSSPPGGITPYQALIVASLVQREAKADGDRAQIASVIYNRLAKNLPLGVDATIYYALGRTDNRPLKDSDLAVNSPYNSRAHAGLPPTPIANPQLSSMQAALQPPSGTSLYYVLGPDCVHHVFTSDYRAFLQAKAQQPTTC